MAVLSGTAHDRPTPALPAPGWFQRFNDGLDAVLLAIFNNLMGWLCRASRGYLCPPDMPSIMYPEDKTWDGNPGEENTGEGNPASNASTSLSGRRCCDEKLSGK